MPVDALADAVLPYLERALGRPVDRAKLARIVPLIQERIKVLSEITAMADFFFTEGDLDYELDALLGKKYAGQPREAADALGRVVAAIEGLDQWAHEPLEAAIRPLADILGVKAGDLFGLVRVAVTGKTATPPLFETMEILGREVTVARLTTALSRLS